MPAAPPEKKNATQGDAPGTGTADAGRLRGRALIVPTLLLLLGGISYGGIFSANKLAASVSFPVFAYTFWIALFAGLALLIVGAVTGKLPPTSRAHLLQYLRLALLAVMLPVLATAIAARELPAGVITLVLTLVPGGHLPHVLRHTDGALRGAEPCGPRSRRRRRVADRAARAKLARGRRLGVDAGGAGGRGRCRGLQRRGRRLPPAQDAFARARLRHPARRGGGDAAGDAGGGRPLSLHRRRLGGPSPAWPGPRRSTASPSIASRR